MKRDMGAIHAAVAELYYFKRYSEAIEVLEKALAEPNLVDGKEKERLERWRERCRIRVGE